MKTNIFKSVAFSLAALSMVACENTESEFDDFTFQAVYFAQQTPVRTITLGEDIFSTELDNGHDFEVYATLSGVYENKKDRTIQIEIDNELVNGLYFKGTENPVEALPSDYYELQSKQIVIPSGKTMGCVKVHLTEKFFQDPKSVSTNYVLPVKMVSQQGADTILSGIKKFANEDPSLSHSNQWTEVPKNYTLYGVKYKNEYTGNWIVSGSIDQVGEENRIEYSYYTSWKEGNNEKKTEPISASIDEKPGLVATYDNEYVERNKVSSIYSLGLKECNYHVQGSIPYELKFPMIKFNDNIAGAKPDTVVTLNVSYTYDTKLTFDGNNITLVSNDEVAVCKGEGTFTKDGAPKAWGNKDRDLIKLQYTADIVNPFDFKMDVPYTYIVRDAGGTALKSKVKDHEEDDSINTATIKITGTKVLKSKVTEELISRDRANKFETFEYEVK